MKRNNLSNRSKKFIARNSLDSESVKTYVSNLASSIFQLENYEFILFKKNMAFRLGIKNKNYYMFLDKEMVELIIYEDREVIKRFTGDSCWYQGLKFIKEKILTEEREIV